MSFGQLCLRQINYKFTAFFTAAEVCSICALFVLKINVSLLLTLYTEKFFTL